MPEHAKHLHIEWKVADDLAASLERQLKQEWEAFFAGSGPAPSDELLDDARHARELSVVRLTQLVEYMHTAARGPRS